MAKWLKRNKQADFKKMSQVLGVSEILCRILVNRDINTKNTALKFLNPTLQMLENSSQSISMMKDMVKAFEIVKESIRAGERIIVYGDYDVDGVMSTSILLKGLRGLGGNADYYIPDRVSEGYGLNMEAVQKLGEQGTQLLILCDNGIASIEEIALANCLGIQSVIIDHHEPITVLEGEEKKEVLPKACALIDPKQVECTYPFKHMCAAGLCYRFICGLYQHMVQSLAADCHDELLALAAIATFCDIVDLWGDNRIIAKNGLDVLNSGRCINMGLSALIEAKGYKGKHIGEFAVGFVIGPCINASGRLDSAGMAVELFITQDEIKAAEYAKKLADLNEERKAMTLSSFKKLAEDFQASEYREDKVIVVYDDEIHESIAGIVAGRLKDRFFHPAIVLTKGDGAAKGSARSIEGYNIYEELAKCRHLFERFGGHAMAAGLTLKEENIPLLRQALNENCTLTADDFEEIIRIDMELPVEQVTYHLARQLQMLRPFGKANKEPLFGSKALPLCEIRIIEEKDTLIFTFVAEGYRRIKGICFGKVAAFKSAVADVYDEYDCNKIFGGMLRNIDLRLDIIYYIDINEYNNNVAVQMNIKDFRISV